MMTFIRIKPLTVNQCWQGKRFKTPAYKKYERDLLLLLPNITVPEGLLKVEYVFGVSNMAADIDNPIKPLQDILQKKYLFNDSRIIELRVTKKKTEKGGEFIAFQFTGDNNESMD